MGWKRRERRTRADIGGLNLLAKGLRSKKIQRLVFDNSKEEGGGGKERGGKKAVEKAKGGESTLLRGGGVG